MDSIVVYHHWFFSAGTRFTGFPRTEKTIGRAPGQSKWGVLLPASSASTGEHAAIFGPSNGVVTQYFLIYCLKAAGFMAIVII
jgi:hypothetical protein